MSPYGPTRHLEIGEVLSQEEIADVFDTKIGYELKGILYRNPDRGPYIVLTSNEGEIYDDQVGEGERFTYDGEGKPEKGDQQMKYANKELARTLKNYFPIYFFTSEEGIDAYEYEGLVDVEDIKYVSDGSRMVYKFQMRRLGVATWGQYLSREEDVLSEGVDETQLTDDVEEYTSVDRRVRSASFAKRVKQLYEFSCALCGADRVSPEGIPEVEAAHIYPKSEGGRDVVRNGLSLCRFHHWAFDHGWFGISDDGRIVVNRNSTETIPEEVEKYEGDQLSTPSDQSYAPDELFLRAHRELHRL